MTAVEVLIDWLEQPHSVGGATIVGWRFEVVESDGMRVGVRDSRAGGPYEGPGVARRLGGGLEVHWSDGLVTRAVLDRRAVFDPEAELENWRGDAVAERHGRQAPLAGPGLVPDVATFDAAAAEAVVESAATCPRMLRHLTASGFGMGVRRIDGVMRVSRGERTVATSRGFRASWQETACSIDVWADEVAGASYGRRCLPSGDELDRLAEEISTLAAQLGTTSTLPAKARGVLFMPGVTQELFDRFLLPNLAGRAIRDGRSLFSQADMQDGRQVLRSDLDLTIDTTRPLELATAPCSAEGVPAGCVRLIAAGRLASPVLDLATATELGLSPTPTPRGRPAVLLTSSLPAIDLGAALDLLGNGVVVRDLPGLHTQPTRRASYALVAPDAQVVAGGEAMGRCAVRLAGRLLDHLSLPSMRLVRIPGDLSVGLLVLTGVELLPA